jgi:exonuclease SbcD
VRVLHTSDWHLGRLLRAVPLIDHQRAFITWLSDLARDRNVDAILVSGDIYDRAIPSVEAVALLEEALELLPGACPVVLISGNHDSTVRLGFAGRLLERAGVHFRSDVGDVGRPVVLGEGAQTLLVYGIPYLEPEVVRARLGTEKSHAAVLSAAMDIVRADLAERRAQASAAGLAAPRSVVMAHAFVTGGHVSDSERDVSVGGVSDAPASVFAGVDYVALGHLHGPQSMSSRAAPPIRYSGSPLAYSFSEEGHRKSVAVVDIAPDGTVDVELVPTPVPRRLATIIGPVEELLADPDLAEAEDAWVRAIVTDPRRPEQPMDRLRSRFPHTIELSWQPPEEGGLLGATTSGPSHHGTDPVATVLDFIRHVSIAEVSDEDVRLVRESVERVRIAEAGA